MAEATFIGTAADDDPAARIARRTWLRNRLVIYGVLGLFAAVYLLPLAVVVMNSFRPLPEIAEHGLINVPPLAAPVGLGRGVVHLLHQRRLRGDAPQLHELAVDDDPGHRDLDAAGRSQRLHPVEVALPRLRGAVHLHAVRRVHPGPAGAAALGLHSRPAGPAGLDQRASCSST